MTQRSAAILGLGRTGGAWADALHDAGWAIRAFDPDERPEGRLPKGASARRVQTISGTVRDASWVFISLPQRVELIQKVMQRAQAEAPDHAVIVTTARDLDLDTVQGCARRPERVVMLRPGEDGRVALFMTGRNDETIRGDVLALLSEVEGALDLPAPPVEDDDTGNDAAFA